MEALFELCILLQLAYKKLCLISLHADLGKVLYMSILPAISSRVRTSIYLCEYRHEVCALMHVYRRQRPKLHITFLHYIHGFLVSPHDIRRLMIGHILAILLNFCRQQ